MFWGCTPPAAPPGAAGPPPSRVQLTQAVWERFEGAERTSTTQVAAGWFDREARVVAGDTVLATLATRNGPIYLQAAHGESDLRAAQARLWGGVKIEDNAARRLSTEVLRYNHRRDELTSDGPVRLEGQNFWLVAEQLSGQPRAGTLELLGVVRAQVQRVLPR